MSSLRCALLLYRHTKLGDSTLQSYIYAFNMYSHNIPSVIREKVKGEEGRKKNAGSFFSRNLTTEKCDMCPIMKIEKNERERILASALPYYLFSSPQKKC